MGKHNGPSDSTERRAMTDKGIPFQALSPEDKGKEFDASHGAPLSYAVRNFGAYPEAQQTRQGRQG